MIYLDSAATTPVSDEVFEAMLPWMKDKFGNAGSVYKIGQEAKAAIEDARSKVARMFNADPRNIIFTSGGSEGNSFAFQAAAERLEASGKKHILVSSVEHDSVLRAAESLTKRGFYIEYLPVTAHGYVQYDVVEKAITPDTGLVSVMFVNNETGSINMLDKIGELCRSNDIIFHTDCVQAAGFLPIDVEKICCDFATISAHKFHGPKGVGCVYVREPEYYNPIIFGGNEQERGLRGGTENVAGIIGMGVASEIAMRDIYINQEFSWKHRIKFWEALTRGLGDTVRLNGQWLHPSRILNVRVNDVDADTLVMLMSEYGVCVSAGSACRSKELKPSHVLLAMGLSENDARNSVRISFSDTTTEREVCDASKLFIESVNLLRGATNDFEE